MNGLISEIAATVKILPALFRLFRPKTKHGIFTAQIKRYIRRIEKMKKPCDANLSRQEFTKRKAAYEAWRHEVGVFINEAFDGQRITRFSGPMNGFDLLNDDLYQQDRQFLENLVKQTKPYELCPKFDPNRFEG